MKINEKITEVLEDINNPSKQLSIIMNKCLRIAYYFEDIEEIFWIQMNNLDMKSNSFSIKDELIETIIKKFDKSVISAIRDKNTIKYANLRKVKKNLNELIDKNENENDMVLTYPVLSIEETINSLKHTLENRESELHYNDLSLIRNMVTEYNKVLTKLRKNQYEYILKKEKVLIMGNKGQLYDKTTSKNIFIIHGKNEAKWRELKSILIDDFKLNPIVLQEQADMGKTIIEKFEYYACTCSYAFAIFTPDDIIDSDGDKYFQARPNVLFELGWFCSFLSRKNVCLLFQEDSKMSIFSDFQGVLQKRFHSKIGELFKELQNELKEVGII